MIDAHGHIATHTRDDVVKAAEIRAQLCAARGLPESQACHPPGIDACGACGRPRETAAQCEHWGVCEFAGDDTERGAE